MKYILPAITIVVLATGCTRGPNGLPVLKLPHRTIHKTTVVEPIRQNVQYSSEYSAIKQEKTTVASHVKQKKKVMYASRKSTSHRLKPEPYSIASGEKDPELLGPQTTIKRSLKSSSKNKIVMPVMKETDLTKGKKSTTTTKSVSKTKKKIVKKSSTVKKPKTIASKEATPSSKKIVKKQPTSEANNTSKKHPSAQTTKTDTPMTKTECVKMIGESKFSDYVNRFGGESGAVKRCVILKKLKG